MRAEGTSFGGWGDEGRARQIGRWGGNRRARVSCSGAGRAKAVVGRVKPDRALLQIPPRAHLRLGADHVPAEGEEDAGKPPAETADHEASAMAIGGMRWGRGRESRPRHCVRTVSRTRAVPSHHSRQKIARAWAAPDPGAGNRRVCLKDTAVAFFLLSEVIKGGRSRPQPRARARETRDLAGLRLPPRTTAMPVTRRVTRAMASTSNKRRKASFEVSPLSTFR